MCGFLLWVTSSGKGIDKELFTKSLAKAKHRGPDNTNILFSDLDYFPKENSNTDSFCNIALGHNRLSLVDLSSFSNQPFIDSITGEALLYNGEYYNFRNDFPNLKSDTQAIFNLIQKEGINGLKRVNGMYSLIYFNLNTFKKEIILARDQFGKKPLFYYGDNKNFVASSDFASIKNIVYYKKFLNLQELGKYISGKNSTNFIGHQTIWKDIHNVIAGSNIKFSLEDFSLCTANNSLKKNDRLDNFRFSKTNDFKLSNLDKDIKTCVEERLMSDADIAVTISGGLDSSLIAIYANQFRKYSNKRTGFYTCLLQPNGKPTKDLIFSRKLADKLDVELNEVNPLTNDQDYNAEILIEATKKIIYSHRSPINLLTTTFPNYFISEAVSKDGYKAILDGVGGDEMMGGYAKAHLKLYYSNMIYGKKINTFKFLKNFLFHEILIRKDYKNSLIKILKPFITKHKNKLIFKSDIDSTAKLIIDNLKLNNEKENFIKNGFNDIYNLYEEKDKLLTYKSLQEHDLFTYRMMTFLEMIDTTSMVHGVENRSPFLDQRLLKYLNMPDNFKFRFGLNKYALRKLIKEKGFKFLSDRALKEGSSSPFPLSIFKNNKIRTLINKSKFLIDLIGKDNLFEFSLDPFFNAKFLSIVILENINDF